MELKRLRIFEYYLRNVIPLNNANNSFTLILFHPALFGIIKRITFFHYLIDVLTEEQDSSFLPYKTLRAMVRLFFLNFFQSSFSDG